MSAKRVKVEVSEIEKNVEVPETDQPPGARDNVYSWLPIMGIMGSKNEILHKFASCSCFFPSVHRGILRSIFDVLAIEEQK